MIQGLLAQRGLVFLQFLVAHFLGHALEFVHDGGAKGFDLLADLLGGFGEFGAVINSLQVVGEFVVLGFVSQPNDVC